jgi:hypothetical protein
VLKDVPVALYMTPVEPRPGLRVEEAQVHAILLAALVFDEDLRAELDRAGLTIAKTGNITDDDLDADLPHESGIHFDLRFEDEGNQEFFGGAVVPGEASVGLCVAYTMTPNGLVRIDWSFEFPTTSMGAIWYESEPDTFPAKFVGSDPVHVAAGLALGDMAAAFHVEDRR